MRVLRLVTLAALVAAFVAPAAFGFGFTDEALLTPNGVLGHPYSYKLDARNGCPPYTFHVDSGNLPPGLSMSASGEISGTPTAVGTWSWWGRVTNACPADHSERQLSITIAQPAPAIVRAPVAEVGVVIAAPLFAADDKAPAPFRWTTAGALPPGVAVDNTTHALTGAPTVAGTTTLGVAVANERGALTPLSLTFVVAPRLAVPRQQLPLAHVGRAYRARIASRGGVAPVRWQLGRLPRGLRFDAARAMIVGVPHRAAAAAVAVRGRDRLGAVAQRTLTLRIAPR